MEYLVFFIVLVAFFIFIMIRGYFEEKKKQKKFELSLRDNYGKLPSKEYKPQDYECVSHYYEKHANGFQIDDITWNDLGMDAIFLRMDYTHSSAGMEYLYHRLRTPFFEQKELKSFDRKISYYMQQEEERVTLQLLFAKLGTTGRFSLYDYLEYLDDLGKRTNRLHYIGNVAMLCMIFFITISPSLGFAGLVSVMVYNVTTYFGEKHKIEPYLTSISYILRLLHAVDGIKKQKPELFQEECEKLSENYSVFKQFDKGSYWVMSGTKMTNNPLDIILDYLKMIGHLDIIQFNKMISRIRKYTSEIDEMITTIGYMETILSIGAYRASLEQYCTPELGEGIPINLVNAYHPLVQNPIKNSVSVERGVLLTGSNASGKSTFLKTVAINCLLAQTIGTCLAEVYQGGGYRLYSSMALRDDLTGGNSYYMVEIKALKRILDAIQIKDQPPVLCIVDEVLRGTNTLERIAASTQILKSLSEENVLCFAATHDIELTQLLERHFDNYHFEEDIIEGDVVFNYQLKTGKATTRNAIKLLSVMGYDEQIIIDAEEMVSAFLKEGTWNS